MPSEVFFVGLSSIHWREAWKYGERAYRYCQHDVGHALAALAYSAATLGWRVALIATPSDDDISRLLGLDRSTDFDEAEREHPDLLAAVVPAAAMDAVPVTLPASAVDALADGSWTGKANRLSAERMEWELVDAAADACRKPPSAPSAERRHPANPEIKPRACLTNSQTAGQIIRQRRSATAMDRLTHLPAEGFYAMLARTMPGGNNVLAAAPGPPAHVHLVLFVHRVTGLAPGLYCLIRSPEHRSLLQTAMRPEFAWSVPPGVPDDLPLFQLAAGDCREASAVVSCGQEIASDGAFAVAMLAEFAEPIRRHGGWYYRRLFWETGCIGQTLYLEAEAAGVRGTGIGCFFDDPVHELCGLSGHAFQSLYHFTVGGAVEDARLTTRPAYSETRRSKRPGLWTVDESEGLPCAR